MDSLFPIKIDIPDYLSSYGWIFHRKKICFLFSSNDKIKGIDMEYRTYFLGEIKKDEKKFLIYYIEIETNSYSKIKIEVSDSSFFLKIRDDYEKQAFLFNEFLYDKKDNKISKLNCFDIYEEFEIYHRIHSEKKNKNSLNNLINSAINIIKNKGEESTLSFFITIFIKESSISEQFDDLLSNIKNKGDLTKIPKNDLYKRFKNKNSRYEQIYLIYLFLSQNKEFEELEGLIIHPKKGDSLIINSLGKYKLLFSNSIQLYPNFSFLLDLSNSLHEIKIILKCSNSLSDFIKVLNGNKEIISQYIKNKEDSIIISNIFDLKKEFNEKLDENFYFLLNEIKEYELENKKILFYLIGEKKIDLEALISHNLKVLIFLYVREEIFWGKTKYMKVEELLLHIPLHLKNLNNFEKIVMIAILSNIQKDCVIEKKVLWNKILFEYIESINFENELEKSVFKKIKWDIFLKMEDTANMLLKL